MYKLNQDKITRCFVAVILWAEDLDAYDWMDVSPRSIKLIRSKVSQFVELIQPYMPSLMQCNSYWSHPDCGGSIEGALGHDLALSMGGYGAGFSDRDSLPRDIREALQGLCYYGSPLGYISASADDGVVYFE